MQHKGGVPYTNLSSMTSTTGMCIIYQSLYTLTEVIQSWHNKDGMNASNFKGIPCEVFDQRDLYGLMSSTGAFFSEGGCPHTCQ